MTQTRNNTKAPSRTNEAKRPPRVKMSAGGKLNAPKREGYQRYWAITGPDHPGKLEQMEAAWWAKVKREDLSDWTVPAGSGNTHVLMEIEEKYYKEDMADQQKRALDASQKDIQNVGKDEYVPLGQTNVVEKEII
jgi:hypothetical protein